MYYVCCLAQIDKVQSPTYCSFPRRRSKGVRLRGRLAPNHTNPFSKVSVFVSTNTKQNIFDHIRAISFPD